MPTSATETPRKPIACIGAAHVDRMARSRDAVVLGSSNPVTMDTASGGVARNVAETVARLGCTVALYSIVGDDREGTELVAGAAVAGVDVSGVRRTEQFTTASYTAVLDHTGELVIGLADMAIYDALDTRWADAIVGDLADYPFWLVDANLPAATIEWLLSRRPPETTVLADPVSASKAGRLSGVLDQVDVLFPDRAEAERLAGVSVAGLDDAPAAAKALRAQGVGMVVLSLGAAGVCLADRRGVEVVPPIAARPRNVTGAGDALAAGFLYGLVLGRGRGAVNYGLAAASLAVESECAVPPTLSAAVLAERAGEEPA